MKRNNKFMRASGILLVLTLITSCFVGGTFAKYVTDDQGADTARVAKWGVTVEAANKKAFSISYGRNDSGADSSLVDTVISGNTEKVVAPGTKGSFGGYDEDDKVLPALTISGTPEVAVNVSTEATVTLENWTDNKDQLYDPYCPLVFTITCDNGTGEKKQIVCGLAYDNNSGGINTFERKIESAINEALNGDYTAGTVLDDLELYITWEWPFNDTDDDAYTDTEHSSHTAADSILNEDTYTHEYEQNDEADTHLGDWVNDGRKAPSITINLETTVKQID